MKIKNWFNSNAWYETSAQHYAKAAPHINRADLVFLLAAISGALLHGLSSPITFKIGETTEITTKSIFEFAYTKNTILQALLPGLHIKPLFHLYSNKINKIDQPIQVFSCTTQLPPVYYFPIVKTDAQIDNFKGVQQEPLKYLEILSEGQGAQAYVPVEAWRRSFKGQYESSFRKLFPESERNQLSINNTLGGGGYYTITPDVLRKLDLTVYKTPITESEEIKYNESELWEITGIAAQYMTKSVLNILIAIALQCALKLAINLTQAAINGDSLEDAASESWQKTKAIGHAFLAARDYAGGCVCKIFIDTPAYAANGIWKQTIGRFYHHDHEHDTDIAGNVANASEAEEW